MVDPLLQARYPISRLFQSLVVEEMCVQEQATMIPVIVDVVTTLTHLVSQRYDLQTHPIINSRFNPPTPSQARRDNEKKLTSSASDKEKVTTNRHIGLHYPYIHSHGYPNQNSAAAKTKT